MASQQQFQRLESFLDDGETTIDGYSTDDEVGVLTDRRVASSPIGGWCSSRRPGETRPRRS